MKRRNLYLFLLTFILVIGINLTVYSSRYSRKSDNQVTTTYPMIQMDMVFDTIQLQSTEQETTSIIQESTTETVIPETSLEKTDLQDNTQETTFPLRESKKNSEEDATSTSDIIESPNTDAELPIEDKENYQMEAGKSYGSISIPSVGINTNLVYGLTQRDVNNNDIIIDGGKGLLGYMKKFILCGHNTKSLRNLYQCSVNDYIYITTDECTYTFQIYSIDVGTVSSDQMHILSNTTNQSLLQFDNKANGILNIYTCYKDGDPTYTGKTNERLVVNAKLIS